MCLVRGTRQERLRAALVKVAQDLHGRNIEQTGRMEIRRQNTRRILLFKINRLSSKFQEVVNVQGPPQGSVSEASVETASGGLQIALEISMGSAIGHSRRMELLTFRPPHSLAPQRPIGGATKTLIMALRVRWNRRHMAARSG